MSSHRNVRLSKGGDLVMKRLISEDQKENPDRNLADSMTAVLEKIGAFNLEPEGKRSTTFTDRAGVSLTAELATGGRTR